jgi:hypothetical protein
MFGNNFGLFGSAAGATRLLRRLHRLTTDRARILASSNDPYEPTTRLITPTRSGTADAAGCPARCASGCGIGRPEPPKFDYLLVSPAEMRELAESADWAIRTFIEDDGSYYVGVLEKS